MPETGEFELTDVFSGQNNHIKMNPNYDSDRNLRSTEKV